MHRVRSQRRWTPKYDTTVCVPSGTWTPSTPKNPGQLFQVDANNHSPNVYIHGGVFMPNNNFEEFTSSASK